mmetsp:Transcript_21427/g.61421  ORF Transcript_21427/g.61421 Transcript_21427/m.61421 type:complete len:350 (-) Transcript_21427:2028-3077(-)
MRGYLLKQKSTASPFGDTNKRWFEIESSATTNHDLILSYYKQPPPQSSAAKNARRRGWIFISDVVKVEEDAVCQWITISHPRRTFRLQALDRKDHRKWYEELSRLVQENGEKAAEDDGELEQQLDAPGSTHIVDNTSEPDEAPSRSSTSVVSRTIHKLPDSTGTGDANQSKASIEIDFLRRINQSTDDFKSPKKRPTTTTPRIDRQNSKRDTPLANRVGRAIKEGGGNAKSRVSGECAGADTTSTSPAKLEAKANDQREESPLWQRHKNRMLLLDESSSDSDCSSSLQSPRRNDSLVLTNKSFADLEDLVSPTGLDTFISKTNRSSIGGNDGYSEADSSSDEDSFGGVW